MLNRRYKPWLRGALLLALVAGCSQNSLMPNPVLLSADGPLVYSDADWALVLQSHGRDGLVDYDSLSRDREPLQRYYALISRTGPATTPDQFQTREQVTAYWINAYNALVLLAALQRYPAETVYSLEMPNLQYDYTFQVDGQPRTLAAIEDIILKESDGDVRALFATSRAAMGTPRLAGQPIRAGSLDRQLATAAAQALDDPVILRIDHETQSILLWQLVLRRQSDFIEFWRTRRRVRTAYLFNVLLELASPRRRQALQSAVGYAFRELPFDRLLNNTTPPATQVAGP